MYVCDRYQVVENKYEFEESKVRGKKLGKEKNERKEQGQKKIEPLKPTGTGS